MEARDKVWKDVVKSEVLTPGDWSIDAYERAVTFNTMKLITRLDAKPLSLPIKSALVVEFHGYMFKSVMTSAGKFTQKQLGFGGFIGSVPRNISKELSALDSRLDTLWQQASSMEERVRILAMQHISLIAIHGFADGNGRIARFVLDISLKALLQKPLCIHDLTKDAYLQASNCALTTNQLGFLTQKISKEYGIEALAKHPFYCAPYALHVEHQDISQDDVTTINRRREVPLLNHLKLPSTMGRWLGQAPFEKLLELSNGKESEDAKKIKHRFDLRYISLEDFAVLLFEAQKTAIKPKWFSRFDRNAFKAFFEERVCALKAVLSKEQYKQIIRAANQVIDKGRGVEELRAALEASAQS